MQKVFVWIDLPETAGKSLQKIIETIDGEREKIVLFHRPEEDFPMNVLIAFFQEAGIEVVVHPIDDDRPLMFGMSGQFR